MGNANSQHSAGGGRRLATQAQQPLSAIEKEKLGLNNHAQTPKNSMLRTKRKSLELPDLAHLTITSPYPPVSPRSKLAQGPAPKSASIPIPTSSSPEAAQSRPRGPRREESDGSVQHYENVPNGRSPYERQPGTPTVHYGTLEQTPSARMAVPPPTRNHSMAPISMSTAALSEPGYEQVVVRSSIPQPPRKESADLKPILVKITWTGGGKKVFLARAGDEDWKGRREMTAENEDSPLRTITIPLLPGTHHLRFLVDSQWRVADDLPTAVDDSGSLANYVAVALDGVVTGGGVADADNLSHVSQPLPSPSSPNSASPRRAIVPAQSFWSTASAEDMPGPSSSSGGGRRSSRPAPTRWTDEIPLELSEAAIEEDAYLQATSGTSFRGHTHVVNGFVPLPQIPPAPALPKHLEKLILNQKTPQPPHGHGTTATSAVHTHSHSHSSSLSVPGTPSRGSRREHKERSGRQRDRDRSAQPPSDSSEPTSASTSPTTPIRPSSPITSISLSNSTRIAPPLDDTVIADDTSVLPVPSHVVLHHLTTSAIRNGVLAVGETVRYRKKYVTTIYYKPTD